MFYFWWWGGGRGDGVEIRPVDRGSAKKVLLWPQNGVILVGLDLIIVAYSDSVGYICLAQ